MSNETYDVYHVWLTDRSDPDFVDGEKLMWVDDDSFPAEVYTPGDGQELYGGEYVFRSERAITGEEHRIIAEAEEWQHATYFGEGMEWDSRYIGYIEKAAPCDSDEA